MQLAQDKKGQTSSDTYNRGNKVSSCISLDLAMDPGFFTSLASSILCYVGSEAAFIRIRNGFHEFEPELLLTLLGFAVFTVLYYLYHALNFGKLPELYCKENTKLHEFIKDNVATLQRPYKPPVWCGESRLQTIVRYFTPCRTNIKWKREKVTDKEEGTFYIDWFHNEENARFSNPDLRPTVIIVPGLTSTSSSSYILSMANCLAEEGYRIAVIIYRGLDGSKLKTPISFSATFTGDLERVLQLAQLRHPQSDLYAVGASLGSMILGRYLSQQREKSLVKAGVLFCCPFDPNECIKEMETPSNLLLMNYQVTQNIKKFYRRNSDVFKGIVDDEKVERSKFIRDFDNHFTARVFGYENGEEYYKEASLVERLRDIDVPVLCVGANDDPFSPERGEIFIIRLLDRRSLKGFFINLPALPKKEICESDNVALVMTYGGGHVSHIEEQFPFSKSYFELIMMEYLRGFQSK